MTERLKERCMVYRKRMNIYGGQKMALAKMKGIRRKKEVLMHG